MEFFSFISQSHSFNSRQVHKQISPALVILKLSYFGKNDLQKIPESFTNFYLWYQEIDL